MRYIQLALFLIVLAAIGVFAWQNRALTTISFLNWSLSAPLALLSVVIYLLGMISGWGLIAFFRRSIRQLPEPRRD